MLRDNFCTFILTHGRAGNVITYKTLKAEGYTGPLFLVVDNEDSQIADYQKNFGKENVLIFDKLAISKTFDTADTFEDRRTIVYARNACFDLAKEKGYRYFLELDDDYTIFAQKYDNHGRLSERKPKSLDDVFEAFLQMLDSDSRILTVAMAQGGDFIGGLKSGNWKKPIMRKAMNTFFCDVTRRFDFLGRVNEDVNTYTVLGQRGKLLFSFRNFSITQKTTQKNKGGMTEQYLDAGTYVKSFYSVMMSPSCVKIAGLKSTHARIHHQVRWENCVPKILNEKWKK